MFLYIYVSFSNGSMAELKSFNCNTKQVKVYNIPQLTSKISWMGQAVTFWTLDWNTLFISGGVDEPNALKDCYTFNISNNTFVRKQNMNVARYTHGL